MSGLSAICPGSFDPVTYGHLDIFRRAAKLFGKVTVLVMQNSSKKSRFTPEERCNLIKACLGDDKRFTVITAGGLCAAQCRALGGTLIVKGLRNSTDFEYERDMAALNLSLGAPETVFLPCAPELAPVSSSVGFSIYTLGGDVSGIFPAPVCTALAEKYPPCAKD